MLQNKAHARIVHDFDAKFGSSARQPAAAAAAAGGGGGGAKVCGNDVLQFFCLVSHIGIVSMCHSHSDYTETKRAKWLSDSLRIPKVRARLNHPRCKCQIGFLHFAMNNKRNDSTNANAVLNRSSQRTQLHSISHLLRHVPSSIPCLRRLQSLGLRGPGMDARRRRAASQARSDVLCAGAP